VLEVPDSDPAERAAEAVELARRVAVVVAPKGRLVGLA